MVDGLTARIDRAERDADAHEAVMAVHEREHAELARRVRLLETELDVLRRERIDAYARWWNAREDRDRTRHIARRLRRRLQRLRRRLPVVGGCADGYVEG
ncbi:septation ring formation regulator EzrA [Spinactinospora alkalitolerans]|uniref:Septation ring formation regulator EzrA n=1 Tax=Spinactinospora alkalitolerans TaxID=687207 RepID=A0A852TQD5_9ACTN|nr:hypothetical protein [Spinactinospora alkalitolerans]NYE46168.1 septation ring formation regulator EzrA [Spinactinospora alkalitolerans]